MSMIPFSDEIDNIKKQVVNLCNPSEIILFGSCAAGSARDNSDIDLCIICNYEDKQKLLINLLINVECERDVDFILYRPEEWDKYKKDTSTFANLIYRKGVTIHG